MSKKLSIIIPFYKGEKFLGKTLTGLVEKQKYEPKEIIVVDDGSPNSTDNFWESVSAIDPCIRICHKENGGIADARNFGLKEADGELIAFFDQDDDADENMYSELIEMMGDNDFIASNYYAVIDGNKRFQNIIEKNVKEIEGKNLVLLRAQKAYGALIDISEYKFPSTIWNCIFKKSIIDDNNIRFFANVDYDDDYNFLVDYLSFCRNVSLCKNAFYCWTIRADSESHRRKYIADYYEKLKKQYEYKRRQIVLAEDHIQMENDFSTFYWGEAFFKLIMNELAEKEDVKTRDVVKVINSIREKENVKCCWKCFNSLWKKRGKKQAGVYFLCMHKLTPAAVRLCR